MSTFILYFLPATWLSCEPPFNCARYPFSYILCKASLLDHWYQSNTTETTSQFYFFFGSQGSLWFCWNFGPLLSSPELKAQVSFSDHLSVRLWTFHIFIFSRTTGPISTKLVTKRLWVEGIQVCSNEGPHPFQRGDN